MFSQLFILLRFAVCTDEEKFTDKYQQLAPVHMHTFNDQTFTVQIETIDNVIE